jgi:pyruvate,water dikinase
LRDASPALAGTIGNKAAGLAGLHSAGFRVPDGFCITTEVFRAWRDKGAISDAWRAQLAAAFANLRHPVAVRSSSPAEDRAEASFAGQYQTILGVQTEQQFFAALETCWNSASSKAARSYRKDQGAEADVEMAVLVQELVPATAAGVLFTMHPVTDRVDQVVVNANFGLGESVVSGRTEPDTFILDKATGVAVERTLGAKRIVSRQTERGVEEAVNDADRQAVFSLTDGQLFQLADVARKLEARYDMPMDAEWAFEGETLHMLQARPVTTGAAAYYTDLLDQWARDRGLEFDPDAIWARGSPLSGLAVSPLYYSEMAAFFSDMFPRVAELHGGQAGKRRSFRYHNGYTYSDVTFSSPADPSGTIQPIGFFDPQWRSNVKLGLRYPNTLAFWTNIDAYYQKWHHEWLPGIEARRPDYQTANIAKIQSFIEYIEAQRRERSIYAALGVGYAGSLLGLLAYLVQNWAPGMPEDTIGVLTSGVEESLTHEENVDVGKLADAAAESPAVREAVLARKYRDLENIEEGKAFLRQIDTFRTKHPHRGCSDRDLYQPRWGDDREILLNQMNAMLSLGRRVDPDTAHAKAAARRMAREDEVLRKIGRGSFGSIRSRIFRRVLRLSQRYWIHRDNQRHSFDHYFYELRGAYTALGQRLAKTGALQDPEGIFFVAKSEIYEHLAKKIPAERLRARAVWRRIWWNRVRGDEPPAFLKGNLPYQPDARPSTLAPGDLGGIGGAPGVVTGPVRLVKSLAELGSVAQGDILVTHAIDPAWTPVFGIIGGVISEEGGILSHATVLGREYGLPVVIGVPGAATALRDGDVVEVDGTSGIVRRVVKAPAPASAEEPECRVVSTG